MAHQIKPSVTNPTIADIYGKIVNGQLELAPDFQRKFVWTHKHQEEFLGTILSGYPFPEIYVCQGEIDTKTISTKQKVIDGQQRLTTIKNYIDDVFEKALTSVPRYQDLSDQQKQDFVSYQVVVRDIGPVPDDLVREIFRRINLTKFKLNDIEIHNAVYDGEFIQTGKVLADSIDLRQFGVFFDSEFSRMADLHFFLLVMSTLARGGYFSRDTELAKCVAEFNEEFPQSESIRGTIEGSIKTIQELELKLDSIWLRKSNFFTLVVELSNVDTLPNDIKSRLENFESKIMENRYENSTEFGTYYSYMYTGTNSRKARVIRSELLRKHVLI